MAREGLKLRKTEHDWVQERLSSYMDQEISRTERERVDVHLAQCAACREDLRTLRWTQKLLQETPPVRVPRAFVIREADVTEAKPARRTSWFAMQWAATVVAALFVLVLAGDMITGAWLRRGVEQPAPMLAAEEQVERGPVMRQMVESEEAVAPSAEASPFSTEEAVATRDMPTPAPGSGNGQEDMLTQESEKVGKTAAVTETAKLAGAAPEGGTPEVAGTAEPERLVEREDAVETEGVPMTGNAKEGATPEQDVATSSLVETLEPPAPEVSRWPLLGPTRIGWRVTEIVLAVVLVGLVIAILWNRQRG